MSAMFGFVVKTLLFFTFDRVIRRFSRGCPKSRVVPGQSHVELVETCRKLAILLSFDELRMTCLRLFGQPRNREEKSAQILSRNLGFGLLSILTLLSVTSLSISAQESPQRIISLAPHITEIIFKLGAQDRLVGRSEFCLYPEAAQNIPSVGAYLNPDYEKIVSLEPEVVFLFPNTEMERKLQRLGLHIFSIPDETIEEVLFSIKAMGRVLGLEERAQAIVSGIEDTLNMAQRADTSSRRPSALLLVGREGASLKGLYAAGKDTYLSEIWTMCGGSNVFADMPMRYFNVSKEDLIKRNPDCILEFRIIAEQDSAREVSQLRSNWKELPVLQAVKEDRIFVFTDRYFLIPGPRISRIVISFLWVMERLRND